MTVDETKPDPKKWDLKAALMERTYAKQTVPIFLDEDEMFRFNEIAEKAMHLDDAAIAERDEMAQKFSERLLWITVQAVPRHVLKNLDIQMLKEYPITEDMDSEYVIERNDEFTKRYWQLYVVATKGPDGEVKVPDSDTIELLIKQLPDASYDAVEKAIKELREGAKSGYENAVMELGFL